MFSKTYQNIVIQKPKLILTLLFLILLIFGYFSKEFKRANEANQNKDFGQLLEMADQYGIDVPMDDRMMNEVSLQIKAVVDTITNMKSTWAWTWVHIDKGNKEMFKKYILQQLTVE